MLSAAAPVDAEGLEVPRPDDSLMSMVAGMTVSLSADEAHVTGFDDPAETQDFAGRGAVDHNGMLEAAIDPRDAGLYTASAESPVDGRLVAWHAGDASVVDAAGAVGTETWLSFEHDVQGSTSYWDAKPLIHGLPLVGTAGDETVDDFRVWSELGLRDNIGPSGLLPAGSGAFYSPDDPREIIFVTTVSVIDGTPVGAWTNNTAMPSFDDRGDIIDVDTRPDVDRWDVVISRDPNWDVAVSSSMSDARVDVGSSDSMSGAGFTPSGGPLARGDVVAMMVYDFVSSDKLGEAAFEAVGLAGWSTFADDLSMGDGCATAGSYDVGSLGSVERSIDMVFALPEQSSPSSLTSTNHGSEGGFVDIDDAAEGAFTSFESMDEELASDTTSARRTREADLVDPWSQGEDHGRLEESYGTLEDRWLSRQHARQEESPGSRAQDATWSCDDDEGGMIVVALASDDSSMGQASSAASAVQWASCLPDRKVELASGIGLYQAFDVAAEPLQSAPAVVSPSQVARQEGSSNEMAATDRPAEASSADESAPVEQQVSHEADTSTVIITSAVMLVAQRQRQESTPDRRRSDAR